LPCFSPVQAQKSSIVLPNRIHLTALASIGIKFEPLHPMSLTDQ
jgi:hypothetical protein